MSDLIVNIPFKVRWRFKEHPEYKVTTCKKIINSKTNKMLKYHPRGFYINGKYLKRNEINTYLELIPKQEYIPF